LTCRPLLLPQKQALPQMPLNSSASRIEKKMDIRDQMNTWGQGLQHSADALIKRGTAMSGIIPTLFLVPVFLGAAWLFRGLQPLLVLFSVSAVGIVVFYLYSYLRFATKDPDRLQSEEYRYGIRRLNLISGTGLREPVTAEELPLEDPTYNPALESGETEKGEI
jgi:hypothetical protein